MKQQSIILSQQDTDNIETIWKAHHVENHWLTKKASGTVNTSGVIRFALEELARKSKRVKS